MLNSRTSLCLPTKRILINKFSPEVYLKNSLGDSLRLSPLDYTSTHKVFLSSNPSLDEWSSVLALYPIENRISFSRYVLDIKELLSKEALDNLCLAYNGYDYSSQKEDIQYFSKLDTYLSDFFLIKNIPISVLKFYIAYSQEKIKKLHELLLAPFIKNSVAKNILKEYLNLNEEQQTNFFNLSLLQYHKTNKDAYFFLNQSYTKIIHKIKYPTYSALKEKIDSKIASLQLPKNITLKYDSILEEDTMEMNIKFSNSNELLSVNEYLTHHKKKIENIQTILKTLQN